MCVESDGLPTDGSYADFVVSSPPGQPDPVIRLAGNDRVRTAVETSRDIFPDGSAGAVVLARSDGFADALPGTPLATSVGGPLLLTGQSSLDSATLDEIDRVLGGSGFVYLLGGTGAISDAVRNALELAGYDVERLAGADRYETAIRIANEIHPNTIFVATGLAHHDGLAAGAAASSFDGDRVGAVLLTADGTMPAVTQDYLARHRSLPRYAVGSAAATADPTAVSIAGTSPADTSRLLAERFFPAPIHVSFASTSSPIDALSGGPHAAAFGAPLLFTGTDAVPISVFNYLRSVKSSAVIGFVYGGTGVISENGRSTISQGIS
jgi:hypothetical protein